MVKFKLIILGFSSLSFKELNIITMESSNLHHHQDQFAGSSSFYVTGANNNYWNPNLLLTANNLNLNINGILTDSSRDSSQTNVNDFITPSINSCIIQDVTYHNWLGNNTGNSGKETDSHLQNIQEDLSKREGFRPPSTSYVEHDQQDLLSEKVQFKTFSSACQLNELQGGQVYYNSQGNPSIGSADASGKNNYSRIFPSTNIMNPNSPFLPASSSLGMSLQVLDLLASTKFGASLEQVAHNDLGLLKEAPTFDHESSHKWLTRNPNKASSFMNGVTDTRKTTCVSVPKASQPASKKPRTESSRSSLAPFKVRKEKLGDRIAALQQLVSPFGKTDTASVLMEAIGYIKFLQDQVETLSVPYMKSARNNNAQRSTQQVPNVDGVQVQMRGLRNRGLCLVPLSCMSYITGDNL